MQIGTKHVLGARHVDGLVHPALTGPEAPLNPDSYYGRETDCWLAAFATQFS